MKQEDIIYISENLANLCGIPVRVYLNKERIAFLSTVNLPIDPIILVQDEIFNQEKNLSYISSYHQTCYCIQKYKDYTIAIGPVRYFQYDAQEIASFAFKLNIKKADYNAFSSAMSSITNMPLGTVLQSLCSFNYLLNNEKLSLEELIIESPKQEEYIQQSIDATENYDVSVTRNSTLQIEETLTKFVEEGDIDGFKEWIKKAPNIRAGLMSSDYIRQQKNTFIVSATILSRAAIRGGLNYNSALNISDDYIFRCEKCKTQEEISNLNYTMIKELIQKVKRIKYKESPLESKVASYVHTHISKCITLDELCDYLYMTKSNLCLRFKKETGQTINQFIQRVKIDASKEYLRYSSKSLSSIALYFGFSSQSHYSKVFKEIEGISPLTYRQKRA